MLKPKPEYDMITSASELARQVLASMKYDIQAISSSVSADMDALRKKLCKEMPKEMHNLQLENTAVTDIPLLLEHNAHKLRMGPDAMYMATEIQQDAKTIKRVCV